MLMWTIVPALVTLQVGRRGVQAGDVGRWVNRTTSSAITGAKQLRKRMGGNSGSGAAVESSRKHHHHVEEEVVVPPPSPPPPAPEPVKKKWGF